MIATMTDWLDMSQLLLSELLPDELDGIALGPYGESDTQVVRVDRALAALAAASAPGVMAGIITQLDDMTCAALFRRWSYHNHLLQLSANHNPDGLCWAPTWDELRPAIFLTMMIDPSVRAQRWPDVFAGSNEGGAARRPLG